MPTRSKKSLRILISSGPTRERVDPVRFISNDSTGVMGAALTNEALRRGHRVTVVSGPATVPLPAKARIINIESAAEMQAALNRLSPKADALIMAAAVSDWRVAKPAQNKLHRTGHLTLHLEPTPDILAGLASVPGQVRVGFALETEGVLARAARKLARKRLDVVLAQDAGSRRPFGDTPLDSWLLENGGVVRKLGRVSKARVAGVLLDKVEALWYGQAVLRPHFRKGRSGAQRLRASR